MQAGQSEYAADAAAFGANMNSIAHSQAMLAAIRDYQKVSIEHARFDRAALLRPALDAVLTDSCLYLPCPALPFPFRVADTLRQQPDHITLHLSLLSLL